MFFLFFSAHTFLFFVVLYHDWSQNCKTTRGERKKKKQKTLQAFNSISVECGWCTRQVHLGIRTEMLSFPTTSLKVPQCNCSFTCHLMPVFSLRTPFSWRSQRAVLGIDQHLCQFCWDNELARVRPKMFWMLFIVLFIYWLVGMGCVFIYLSHLFFFF